MQKILRITTIILIAITLFVSPALAQDKQTAPDTSYNQSKLPVYFFWGDGCPHCEKEKIFLESISDDYPEINFISYETWNNRANYNLLLNMTKEKTGRANGAVPAIVIGDEVVIGFGSANTTGRRITQMLDIYRVKGSCNINKAETEQCETAQEKEEYKVPLWGKIDIKNMSLPLLTIALGFIDGFNPCSMWALIMLITLLINSGSKKKMWIVGSVFILTSALSYFIFLSAWLNLFLLIGYLRLIQVVIGVFALGAGIYFLRDYYKKRKTDAITCDVTSSNQKNKIIERLQSTLQHNSTLAIIIGTILIAFSVNLIELVCSAGIPAIYTQILSQNELSKGVYYLYLALYDFFYMLDDIIVLIIAGMTWRLFMGNNKYAKYSHLIGGILILCLGLIMLFNPDLLRF